MSEDSVLYSSSDESIVKEQARKLFKISDQNSKGFIVKSDLENISDLLPKRDLNALNEAVDKNEEKFISESEFVRIIKSLTSTGEGENFEEKSEVEEISNDSSSFVPPSVSLEAELTAAEPVEPYKDPLTDILREEMEKSHYPVMVENNNTSYDEHIIKNAVYEPVKIKNPQYRPIQPEAPQTLADELNEVENPGVAKEPEPSPMDMSAPDRIFKVVFVGDSAVGKTCFLHRFCHNRFKPLFNATIGVDFTVKAIPLRDRVVALQLWDTAGQERFRSITKQYFRKADGVVLMFDVTSEQSFLNVRNWVDSVRQGVDESTVMCLVGNKVDLFGSDQTRNAVYRAGKKLAEEFNISFFETSAFTGYGIEHCMKSMAEGLQKREEDHLEEALRLEMNPPKRRSWCCL